MVNDKLKSLLYGATSIMFVTSASHAQEPSHDSVLFQTGVSAYFLNQGFADSEFIPPGGAGEGMASFWWNSGVAPTRNAVNYIIEATYGGTPILSLGFYNTFGVSGIANGTHLRIHLDDGLGHNCTKIADTPLLGFGATWGDITAKWNTNVSPNEIAVVVGSTVVAWNAALQQGCNTVFKSPYPNAPWTVGASDPMIGMPNGFYHGMLAEVVVHAQDGDWNTLSQLGSESNGAAMHTTTKRKSLTDSTIIPVDLGPNCQNIFGTIGTVLQPMICLRGGSGAFYVNHGGDTQFIVPQGYPAPIEGSSDPFALR